ELRQAPRAGDLRAQLGGEIRPALVRGTDVGEEQRQHAGVLAAAAAEEYGRDAQALLVDLARDRQRARRRAAHVGVMRAARDEKRRRAAASRAAEEYRRDEREVRQVGAPGVGIVQEHRVAGPERRERQRRLD